MGTTRKPSLPRNYGFAICLLRERGNKRKKKKKCREELESPTSPNLRQTELKASCQPLTKSLLQPRAAEAPQSSAFLCQRGSNILGENGGKKTPNHNITAHKPATSGVIGKNNPVSLLLEMRSELLISKCHHPALYCKGTV